MGTPTGRVLVTWAGGVAPPSSRRWLWEDTGAIPVGNKTFLGTSQLEARPFWGHHELVSLQNPVLSISAYAGPPGHGTNPPVRPTKVGLHSKSHHGEYWGDEAVLGPGAQVSTIHPPQTLPEHICGVGHCRTPSRPQKSIKPPRAASCFGRFLVLVCFFFLETFFNSYRMFYILQ